MCRSRYLHLRWSLRRLLSPLSFSRFSALEILLNLKDVRLNDLCRAHLKVRTFSNIRGALTKRLKPETVSYVTFSSFYLRVFISFGIYFRRACDLENEEVRQFRSRP